MFYIVFCLLFYSSSINTNLAYLCCFLDLFHYYLPPFGAKLFCLFSLPLLFIIISLTFLSRDCLTRFLFIFIFFHTLHCLCLIKIECVYACVCVFVFWCVFLTFYMLSDGTEFELRVAMLLLFLLLFLLFSTSRFKLFWFAFKVDVFWKLQKTELFRLNVFCIFLVSFLFFFSLFNYQFDYNYTQRLKGSILNHSISYQYFSVFSR